ncbi:expressed unknown protein [Seminavis robusta]|uniref:Ionotropic glutamate receptor C-terminal domain-containing protein n=1 Tax=Seminavis robusta TaxID=568900 RepID=A0A9N8EQ40_9STRA|nr:expressed unknown protein [Seminavis robusta]|eukprot:Sro1647_g288420.1 n/a (653) ;mRNA; f:20796-22831
MLGVAILLIEFLSVFRTATAFGGEKAFFTTTQGTPNVTHRQSVCDRFEDFYYKRVELRHALEGLQVNIGLGYYPEGYFNYDPEKGIDRNEPGLVTVLLDELGRRGGFTWRNSFGVYYDPKDYDMDWNQTLHWSIKTYDFVADWWVASRERLNDGVAFVEEFLDSSFVVITRDALDKQTSKKVSVSSFFNWLKPYDTAVWIMTLFTILLSGGVYQVLEWYADERNDRSAWEWWLGNAYLSFINATQAYEYQPKSLASRIFGISMAIWALVMTATYTANLASLLLDREVHYGPQTMEEIAVFGKKLCTWDGTVSDEFVRDTYRTAVRIPKNSELELYQGLSNGDCDYMLTSMASWNKYKGIKEYNPHCDLFLVGDGAYKVLDIGGGFITTIDSGKLCTGFIRDVLNLLVRDMIEDGFLEQAWEHEFARTQTIDCLTYKPGVFDDPASSDVDPAEDIGARSRQLQEDYQIPESSLKNTGSHHRLLKSGGKGAAGGAVAAMGPGGVDARTLTLEQMIGTFVCHWGLMIIAIVIAHVTAVYDKHGKKRAEQATKAIVDGIASSMPILSEPFTDTEAPTTNSCIHNLIVNDGGIEVSNKTVRGEEEQQVETQNVIAAMHSQMQSELKELRNQIKVLVDRSASPGVHSGALAGPLQPLT